MQHLEVSCAVRPIEWPLGVKWLICCVLLQNGKGGVLTHFSAARNKFNEISHSLGTLNGLKTSFTLIIN